MLWAQLGQSGGRGAHLLECLSRMDRAVLGAVTYATSICWVVDRQPSLLRGCRQMNFWQYRINRMEAAKLPGVEQIFSLCKRLSAATNWLRNIRRPDQSEAFASSLNGE